MADREWTLELGWLPRLNLNSRRHWSKRHADAARWRETVGWLAKAARVPRLTRARVQLTLVAPDRRRRDADNLVPCCKAAVDGLRDAGVLEDDTPDRVEHLLPRIVGPEAGERDTWSLHVVDLGGADG